MEDIQTDLRQVMSEIEKLSTKVDVLQKTCARMDNHVSFIEKTYSTLRTPLEYIRSKFSGSKEQLPELEGNN
jgi:predicted  nucleic acid-binding Zn-ribbon protein